MAIRPGDIQSINSGVCPSLIFEGIVELARNYIPEPDLDQISVELKHKCPRKPSSRNLTRMPPGRAAVCSLFDNSQISKQFIKKIVCSVHIHQVIGIRNPCAVPSHYR